MLNVIAQMRALEQSIIKLRNSFLVRKTPQVLLIDKTNVEPYEVASIIIVNKTYASNRFC